MTPEQIQKLLAGWATGTLTEAEKKALLGEALASQELFDALADEEALRDLLSDPRSRGQLVAALEAKPEPLHQRVLAWFGRPRSWALAGTAAGVILVASVVFQVRQRSATPPARQKVAAVERVTAAPGRRPEAEPTPEAPAQPERRARPAREATQPARDEVVVMGEQDQLVLARPEAPAAAQPAATAREEAAQTAQPAAKALRADAPVESASRQRVIPDARALFDAPSGRPLVTPERATAAGYQRSKDAATTGTVGLGVAGARSMALGLRYSVLQNGVEASPAATFRPHDWLRLSVEANQAGYLYLWREDAGGEWTVLYPSAGEQNWLEAHTRRAIPPAGALPSVESGGQQKLLVILSPDPLPVPINPQAYLVRQAPLIRQADRTAWYVVDSAPGPASRLQAEITLTYR